MQALFAIAAVSFWAPALADLTASNDVSSMSCEENARFWHIGGAIVAVILGVIHAVLSIRRRARERKFMRKYEKLTGKKVNSYNDDDE